MAYKLHWIDLGSYPKLNAPLNQQINKCMELPSGRLLYNITNGKCRLTFQELIVIQNTEKYI